MSLILAHQNRGTTRNLVIRDAAGTTITPDAADVVRAIIGREKQTPVLTVSSAAPTANGSRITKGATNELRLDASDLNFTPGVYTMFIDYFDAADAQEWKEVDEEVFVLMGHNEVT